jgi:hypothetical protein
MSDAPHGADGSRLIRAALLAAIYAHTGAAEGALRLVAVTRVGGGARWRGVGRWELMESRQQGQAGWGRCAGGRTA